MGPPRNRRPNARFGELPALPLVLGRLAAAAPDFWVVSRFLKNDLRHAIPRSRLTTVTMVDVRDGALHRGHRVQNLTWRDWWGYEKAVITILGPMDSSAALPPGWEVQYSNTYKRNYFFNSVTGESKWHHPGAGTPRRPHSHADSI